MEKMYDFILTHPNNINIFFIAYPPSLCTACSILAGFSFPSGGKSEIL